MNYKNFLEKLYFGHLDTEVFRSLSDLKIDNHVQELLERFQKISQKFPFTVNCSAQPKPGAPSTTPFR